jgi:S-DNA-T family DNA segregation ATPase FtsK/SpoIIIE
MPRPPASEPGVSHSPFFPPVEEFAEEISDGEENLAPRRSRARALARDERDEFDDERFENDAANRQSGFEQLSFETAPLQDSHTPFDELAVRPRRSGSTPRAGKAREIHDEKSRSARAFRAMTHQSAPSSKTKTKKTKAKSAPRKRASRSIVPDSSRNAPRALPFEIAGILACACGGLLFFYALRPAADGILTRVGVNGLRFLFGTGAPIFAATLFLLGLILITHRQRTNFRAFARGTTAAFLVFLTAAHLAAPRGMEFSADVLSSHGGVIGGAFAFVLRRALGEVGAVISLVAFALVALLLFTETTLSDTATALGRMARGARRTLFNNNLRERASRKYRDVFDGNDLDDEDEFSTEEVEEKISRWSRKLRTDEKDGDEAGSTPALGPARISPFEPIEEILRNAADALPELHKSKNAKGESRIAAGSTPDTPPILESEEHAVNPIEALEAQALASATAGEKTKAPKPQAERKRFGDGPYMPEYFDEALAALDPPIPIEMGALDEDVTRGVQHVEDTLQAFRIDARVTDVKRGPVITRYEVQPAPGVRVSAIANLDRDLARSLSAYAVRIEAPVPGRNVVGIEVPNKKVHLVRMRDVLEIPEFLSAQSKLAFVLGKDIAGQPKWADLTKMPHMLIAGATNSGKSVCLNSIIASILLRASPDEVKLSLIDPKRVELTLFRDIPHLYHPVVVEPKDAVRALRGAIAEMDRRYKLFATRGVRNVASFNSKLEDGEEPLPYLVIVIDELADLMMTAAAEFEKLICRIAQLARATGIHLIVATQRPSVNVITGVIKANIPARVAFAVASQVDSRTILDAVGAERLIGSGDMLFDANTGGKSIRIQGAYLSEEEVNRVVEVVKARYADRADEFEYGLDLTTVDTGDSKIGSDDDDDFVDEKRDELYDEIKAFIGGYEEMSASLIQRKFEIGYPRAGRIVDQLERDGVLGPADGPRPRKVLGAARDLS